MNTRDPIAGRIIGNRRGHSVSSNVGRNSAGRVIPEVGRIAATGYSVEDSCDATLRIKVVRHDSSIRRATDCRVVDRHKRVVAVVLESSCKDLAVQYCGAAGESSRLIKREEMVDRANEVVWHTDPSTARPLSVVRSGFVPKDGDTRTCGNRLNTTVRVVRIRRRDVVGVGLL